MKRILTLVLVIAIFALAMVGCTKLDTNKKSDGVMTYEQYDAAALDDAVVIEGFIQAKQSWWDNKATLYLQDGTGGYFVYELTCTEEEYNTKLVIGAKIKVTGYKTEYKGEIEVDSGASFEVVGTDTWVAPATDVTSLLGKDELVKKQNMFVSFKGMTVKSVEYKGGEAGDDIYLTLTKDGADYDFCVERYLTDPDTEVYKAVGALKAGDVIDVEGFLYWYNGPNPHVTKVTVK
jgi:hypothetical protein